MGQKFAAYNEQGVITAYYDSIDSPAPAGVTALEITDAQWQKCITTRGYTVQSGALVAPAAPTAAQLLAKAQATQTAALQAAYTAAINQSVSFKNAAGVTSTYPSGNTVLANGMTAQRMITTILSAGSAAWTLGKWLDTNNVAQTFTFADLEGLAVAMEAAGSADWTELVSLIAQVQAAKTVEAVQAIVWA